MATVSNSKLILTALCIAAFTTACSDNSKSAPAPQPPVQEQPKPAPVVDDQPPAPPAPTQPAPAPEPERKPEQKAENKPENQLSTELPEAPVVKADEPAPQVIEPAKPDAEVPPIAEVPVIEAPKPETPKVESPKAETKKSAEQLASEKLQLRAQEASKKYGFTVLISQGLRPDEAEKSLTALDEAMPQVQQNYAKTPVTSGEAPRIEPLFDYLVLTKRELETVSMKYENIRVEIDARLDLSRIVSLLKQRLANCSSEVSGEALSFDRIKDCKEHHRLEPVRAFREARESLNEIRKELPEYTIKCETSGEKAMQDCLEGARVFRDAVKLVEPAAKASLRRVTINSHYYLNPKRYLFPVIFRSNDVGEQTIEIDHTVSRKTLIHSMNSQIIQK